MVKGKNVLCRQANKVWIGMNTSVLKHFTVSVFVIKTNTREVGRE